MNKEDEIQKRISKLYEKFGLKLERIVDNFENQYKKFMDETNGESYFQIILRAHLYIEYEMSEILKKRLKNPEELGDKINLNTKLKILLAIGAISTEHKAPINLLNKTRNLFAHDINYKFDEKKYEILLNAFFEGIKGKKLK